MPGEEMPAPILFNALKHHAGTLRRRVREVGPSGPACLAALAHELVVVGTDLMDLYTGSLSLPAIGDAVLEQLPRKDCLSAESYSAWLGVAGYRVVTLAADQSRWVLRLAEDPARFVHLHPGRWSPQTRRVRANVLRTAVLASACAGIEDGDPLDVTLINRVRREYLGLPPIGGLAGDRGLHEVLKLLGR